MKERNGDGARLFMEQKRKKRKMYIPLWLMGIWLTACGAESNEDSPAEVVEEVQEPEIETEEEEDNKTYSKRDLLFLSDYQGEHEILWFDGRFIAEAKIVTGSNADGNVRYYVSITFDEKGADLLEFATTELSRDDSTLFIVLGDEVICDPVVSQPITEGTAIISVNSYDEAKELEEILSREDEEP